MKNLKLPLLLLALAAVSACASAPARVFRGAGGEPQPFLFPRGRYQHRVELVAGQPGGAEKRMDLSGAVALGPGQNEVVVLTPWGTTACRIIDILARLGSPGETRVEIYLDKMRPYEDRIRQYYGVLREMLMAPAGADASPHYQVIERDEHGIPSRIEIRSPDFRATVKVVGYEID